MEVCRLIVDLLKGMVWFEITLFIIIFFRKEIRLILEKLAKMQKWRKGDAEIDFSAGEQQKIDEKQLNIPFELKSLPGLDRNPAIETLERYMHKELEKQDNKLDLLVRLLAEAHLKLQFERIYQIIFGSQIEWLRLLNAKISITLHGAKVFFLENHQNHPKINEEYNFDNWLGYLLNTELINKKDNEKLEITDKGRYFLNYMIDMRRL